jgi:hypothetical protein
MQVCIILGNTKYIVWNGKRFNSTVQHTKAKSPTQTSSFYNGFTKRFHKEPKLLHGTARMLRGDDRLAVPVAGALRGGVNAELPCVMKPCRIVVLMG